MNLPDALQTHIRSILEAHPVVLFMKGTRHSPACGFSASVVEALDALVSEYHTIDVLADGTLREGMKVWSDWPTFPQLYVDGVFLGGADIVKELSARGELRVALGPHALAPRAPTLTATQTARTALHKAAASCGDAVLRLEVSSGFQYDLFFGEAVEGDATVDLGGIVLHLDATSAQRADGATIDYVTAASGAEGFSIRSPKEPNRVRKLSAVELKAMFDARRCFELIDVRTEDEREIACIEGSRLLDPATEHALLAMDRGTVLVFQCHHGIRSLRAAEHFVIQGFREVYNLEGGIEAWSLAVDPKVPRY